MKLPKRYPVVGTPISMTTYEEVMDVIANRSPDRATLIAVCNVHSVMSARRSPALATALHEADVATPDGMPLVWALRSTANPTQGRVYGPDLMRAALRHGVALGWRHYLFGTTPETLDRLVDAAGDIAPGAIIAGKHAPPFRPLSPDEEHRVIEEIKESKADIVWVALGMPKQELWMHRVRVALPGVALVGVGAAFDLLSGRIPQAPASLQRMGLEWLYRLTREPRRLWRRYLINNPAFLAAIVKERLLAAVLAVADRAVWRQRGT